MGDVIAALDIGATKAHLVIETRDGKRIVDAAEASLDWEAEPAGTAASWIAGRIAKKLPSGAQVAALAVGAQGINRTETARALEAALAEQGYHAVAINDGMLIVSAAGITDGIGVIAGTGAIGVGRDIAGNFLAAGGWGWVIGDEGSAAGLVREAARAALKANDEGKRDDGLLGALIRDFQVEDAERLTRRVNDDPTVENWAPHAPAIFAAADAGSALAALVIEDGARHLADLVTQLRLRGAVGKDVVVAGSVIVNQWRLLDTFRSCLSDTNPDLRVHLLRAPPVEGAVHLARKMIRRPP
jgi:N-acetylglucosamine kinase-like BadF-type ATPase